MGKKMMKKVTAVLTGMVLAIGLTACGSRDSGSNTPENRQEEADETLENLQESSALPDQETETQPDAAQAGQEMGKQSNAIQAEPETTSQTENSTDLPAEDVDEASAEDGKTLVVYYSATGNTESVAGYIAAATDADIFVLEPVEPYSSDDLDWTDKNSRVTREHENEDERKVELVSATVDNWDSYDTVFIGYPIWWHIAAWPVDGFIEANDFTGKTVIPFCTSSSSDLGESGELLAEAAGTGEWLEGARFAPSASGETVRAWVEGLDL